MKRRKTIRKIGTIDDASVFKYYADRRRSKFLKPESITNIHQAAGILDQSPPQFYPGESPDDYDEEIISETEGTQLEEEDDEISRYKAQSNKRRKKKRADVPDLQAFILKSRNLRNAMKKDKKHRMKPQDFSHVDGSKLEPTLPQELQGFDDYTRPEGDNELQKQAFHSISSVSEKLFYIRQLTQRLENE